MDNSNLAVACSLAEPELQERRSKVLKQIGTAVLEIKELKRGYAYRFDFDEALLPDLVNLINFEHRCCPFLRLSLNVEPGSGPIWLELSGPEGTKEFLVSIFNQD